MSSYPLLSYCFYSHTFKEVDRYSPLTISQGSQSTMVMRPSPLVWHEKWKWRKERKEVTQSIYNIPHISLTCRPIVFLTWSTWNRCKWKTSWNRCCSCFLVWGDCAYMEPFTALCRLQARCPRRHTYSVEYQYNLSHLTIYYCIICTDKGASGQNSSKDTSVLPDLSYLTACSFSDFLYTKIC